MAIDLIDTHCHALGFADGADGVLALKSMGLTDALICATCAGDFDETRRTAHALHLHYALGLHPMVVQKTDCERELALLKCAVTEALADPLFAAVGEVGMDGMPGACALTLSEQSALFEAQVRLAAAHGLPLSIHSRKALYRVMPVLKKHRATGVLHAFAGSAEEARQCLQAGFKLGFGPTLTYPGSRRIRSLFAALPKEAYVLETDAPYMLTAHDRAAGKAASSAASIREVLAAAAAVRRESEQDITQQASTNARAVFTRMRSQDLRNPLENEDSALF